MEVKTKTEPIDIPKSKEVLKKSKREISPSTGWNWVWGKPTEENIDLTPTTVKSQVTDANILHHIESGEKQQRLKKEKEETEGCEEDTDDQESDEDSSDFEEEEKELTHCEKLEEYREELGYALHEFKKSVEVDLNNVYSDLVNAPEHVKMLFGTSLSIYFEILPQAAIVFLAVTTFQGMVESEVEKRLRQRLDTNVFVEDKNVCTDFDDVDSDSEDKKCV